MKKIILEVLFDYDFSDEELSEGAKLFVEPIQNVKGLEWKFFIINNEEKVTGGLYLFESKEAAMVYIEGDVFNQLKSVPGLTNFKTKIYGIMEEHSKLTRAPI